MILFKFKLLIFNRQTVHTFAITIDNIVNKESESSLEPKQCDI